MKSFIKKLEDFIMKTIERHMKVTDLGYGKHEGPISDVKYILCRKKFGDYSVMIYIDHNNKISTYMYNIKTKIIVDYTCIGKRKTLLSDISITDVDKTIDDVKTELIELGSLNIDLFDQMVSIIKSKFKELKREEYFNRLHAGIIKK